MLQKPLRKKAEQQFQKYITAYEKGAGAGPVADKVKKLLKKYEETPVAKRMEAFLQRLKK